MGEFSLSSPEVKGHDRVLQFDANLGNFSSSFMRCVMSYSFLRRNTMQPRVTQLWFTTTPVFFNVCRKLRRNIPCFSSLNILTEKVVMTTFSVNILRH